MECRDGIDGAKRLALSKSLVFGLLLLLASAVVFFLHSLGLRLTHELVDPHLFRKSQTLMGARDLQLSLNGFLNPGFSLLGKPYVYALEFPLYQGLTRILAFTFGWSLETASRLISTFSSLCGILLLLAVRIPTGSTPQAPHTTQRWRWWQRWQSKDRLLMVMVLILVLSMPMTTGWATETSIDPLAFLFSCLWAHLVARWLPLAIAGPSSGGRGERRGRWFLAVAAIASGTLAALIKITIFLPCVLAFSLITVFVRPGAGDHAWRPRSRGLLRCVALLAGLTLPALAAFHLWSRHAKHVTAAANPFDLWTPGMGASYQWYTGDLWQYLSLRGLALERISHTFGANWIAILVLLALIMQILIVRMLVAPSSGTAHQSIYGEPQGNRAFPLGWFAGVWALLALLLFPNLNEVHDYYQLPSSLLLCIALACLLVQFLDVFPGLPGEFLALTLLLLWVSGGIVASKQIYLTGYGGDKGASREVALSAVFAVSPTTEAGKDLNARAAVSRAIERCVVLTRTDSPAAAYYLPKGSISIAGRDWYRGMTPERFAAFLRERLGADTDPSIQPCLVLDNGERDKRIRLADGERTLGYLFTWLSRGSGAPILFPKGTRDDSIPTMAITRSAGI